MEAAFGGVFVRARASLGVSAFGMQVADIPPNSGDMYPEHDHEYDGQEEVYLLLRGSADLHLPGRVVALDPETFVRVGPRTRRRLRSGANGARILMIGGVPGRAYEPQENTPLGGPEILPCPTASTSLVPGSPPAQLL
jgi:mannose-6-phosphate isomerase-like protein (cupin superfamily)